MSGGSGSSGDRRSRLDATAVALLVACCTVWGLGQVAAKVGLTAFPPLLQAGWRSLASALLLVAWAQLRGLRWWHAPGSLPGGLAAGALFAVEFGCIFAGLQFTTASRMSVFLYLSPFVVALGMPFIARGERLTARQALGLVLAFAGVVWAFAEGFVDAPAAGPRQWIGDALGIAAAVLWGATTLTIRGTRLAQAAPETTLLYQLALSGVALVAAGWWMGERWPSAAPALPWAAFAFQVAVVSFASYLAWFWLVRHYPATRISVFTLLTPLLGLVAGAWLLAEPVTPRLLTALVAVCAGIALVNWPPPRLPPSPHDDPERTPR